jgi:hypothetical protein
VYLVTSPGVSSSMRYHLAHGAGLELEFVAPALRAPASRRYRVRVGDGPWGEPTRAGGLRLAGLDDGVHRLEIAASLDGVTWSPPLRLAVDVEAPWYRRWWALAGAALVLIAMDLHDEMGAGLASIGLLASVANTETLPTDERQALVAQIGTQSQDLGASLSDIVWTLRSGSARSRSRCRASSSRCRSGATSSCSRWRRATTPSSTRARARSCSRSSRPVAATGCRSPTTAAGGGGGGAAAAAAAAGAPPPPPAPPPAPDRRDDRGVGPGGRRHRGDGDVPSAGARSPRRASSVPARR